MKIILLIILLLVVVSTAVAVPIAIGRGKARLRRAEDLVATGYGRLTLSTEGVHEVVPLLPLTKQAPEYRLHRTDNLFHMQVAGRDALVFEHFSSATANPTNLISVLWKLASMKRRMVWVTGVSGVPSWVQFVPVGFKAPKPERKRRVTTGDAEIDASYVVSAADSGMVRALLADGQVRRTLLANTDHGWRLDDRTDCLASWRMEPEQDATRVIAHIQVMVHLAARIEQAIRQPWPHHSG